MQRQYALAFGAGGVNQALTFLLADLLFLLCGVVWLASSLLAEWKDRSPAHRYQGEALFFFGQIISKLRTTSKTMTLTSITLVLAIFLFAAAPVLVGWAEGYLDVRSSTTCRSIRVTTTSTMKPTSLPGTTTLSAGPDGKRYRDHPRLPFQPLPALSG